MLLSTCNQYWSSTLYSCNIFVRLKLTLQNHLDYLQQAQFEQQYHQKHIIKFIFKKGKSKMRIQQTFNQVSQQTRKCVILVIMVTLLWVGVLVQTYVTGLEQHEVDMNIVYPAAAICVKLCTFLSVLVFLIGETLSKKIIISPTLYLLISGEVTGNVSSVDRLWSLVPTVYTGIVTWYHPSPRLVTMLTVASVWSVRLTWNFWRRGGYSWPPWTGCEDYR